MFKEKLVHSLEEHNDGKMRKELEFVFYGRMTDLKQLEKADYVIQQEQWEVKLPFTGKNAAKGALRVRKEVTEDSFEPKYTNTIKITVNESGDKLETSVPSTAEQFVQLKFLAAQGMIKDRYVFNVANNLKFEVDVFKDSKGKQYQWVKIDLEVPSKEIKIPELPIDLHEVIMEGRMERTKEEEEKISYLYNNYFLTSNQYKRRVSTQLNREEVKRDRNPTQDEVLLD